MDNLLKLDIYKISFYFLLYSFLGFILETTFGIFSKGVVESRQSFIFGPFCAIYGIGAILMITFLTPYKDNIWIVIIGSILLGTIAEYSMSFICEQIFHFKWWDYSEYVLNINGRVCLYFSALWGILGVWLIRYFNPWISRLLEESFNSPIRAFVVILLIFIVVDIIISFFALRIFFKKISTDYEIDGSTQLSTIEVSWLNHFNEELMLKTYPNLQIAGTNMNNIYVDSLYKQVQTYYFKTNIKN